MADIEHDVLGAVADLTTRTTSPSTLDVFDWVPGRRALRGEGEQHGGPAPWFGLEQVLRKLAGDGLIHLDDHDAHGPNPSGRNGETLPPVRVHLTEDGHDAIAR